VTDSSLAVGFFQQPNSSGDNGTKPCAYGVHSIECPPAIKQPGNGWFDRKYASLMGPDYLQNPVQQHSVQYGLFGSVAIQGLLESWWAWGMGTPGSKHTTHVEQAGYASFTDAQWRGSPAAVGSTYVRAGDGVVATYTADDAEAMASQFDLQARMYADWCHRNGYTPKLGTMDELHRTTQGEQLGVAFTHAMASQLPNTTTFHTDPGDRYPMADMVALATEYFNGTPAPTPTPSPPGDDVLDPADIQKIIDGVLDAHLPTDGHGGYTTLRKGFPIVKSDAHSALGGLAVIKKAFAELSAAIQATVR
jgi:hypothetical protein